MFIPRSVKRKYYDLPSNDQHINKKKLLNITQSTDPSLLTCHNDSESNIPDQHIDNNIDTSTSTISEDDIKQFSSQQRLVHPDQDEPICIICGKYGEYINDNTDNDVCSLECKGIDTDLCQPSHGSLIRKQQQQQQQNTVMVQHYTAENVHAKWTNYQESDSVRTMTRGQKEAIFKAHDITVKGDRLPRPITSFDQCYNSLGDQLYSNLETNLGWHMATSIQRMAVPVGLAGRDLHVTAPTHSGKTGAFLIPLIVHCQSLNVIHRYKRRGGPYALIVAPTRELCQQLEVITKKLAKNIRNMRTGLLIGGQPLSTQLYRLRKGVQIVIGTPGRILDIAIHHPAMLRLWMIRMVVLDEADAIFGLGFEHQIKEIMGKLSNKAVLQISLFSATFGDGDDGFKTKMYGYLKDPVEISIRPTNDDNDDINEGKKEVMMDNNKNIATPLVRQTVLWVENDKKAKRLLSILNNPKYFLPPILVFVESRLGAEFLTRAIQKRNGSLRVVAMHADKDQSERASIVAGVNNEQDLAWDVVVTTDVLSRGIDLPYVRLVINYDMASTLEDYIHRIGRAVIRGPLPKGSRQQRGWAITFINKEHNYLLPSFTKMLSDKALHQVTPLPSQLKRYL
ncbi:P-loop containing nucleoside triphosphate hydrolase protein [Halteromyces radiatus]|uniref:P-loop containing nucleoside triphosphate hydrolase protein n=1 Tax=Halteromyces radiatus TaxID=101107 RepID=UPI00221F6832|nr:P-loop containing nucleoside triphosphate hydrolase protein [Halteromyces radiatus]KAI8082802.1 P-loop containing nucleoside triphosphate hydrolase protein [Halteromyces radiatus]